MKKFLIIVFLVLFLPFAVKAQDLVGYWKFEEGSGTIVADSSGYGNNGNTYGPSWVDGKIGKALNFDGNDDYVDFGNSNSLNTTSITVSFWLNLASDPNCDSNNNWRSLIKK